MSIRDEFEQHWSHVYKADSGILGESIKRLAFDSYQAATASKQSEIDELKGAIREKNIAIEDFLNINEQYMYTHPRYQVEIQNLRNLLEKSK